MKDKFNAVWVSHSSISDFLKCPQAYYLHNVYRDKTTHHKMTLVSPPLALGQAVHEVVESLSVLGTEKRFKEPLWKKFELAWKKVSGKKGGFLDMETENHYKEQGLKMLEMIEENPGPLRNLAVKIKSDLPYYWLSEEDNIILCGKIDWLEYLKDEDKIHIIDFKTGKKKEEADSLQLPIYYLLAKNCQNRAVSKASYWYLQQSKNLDELALPDEKASKEKLLKIAKQMKLARQLNRFKCPEGEGGCRVCRPYLAIVAGKGEQVGINDFKQDVYIVAKSGFGASPDETSMVL